jgi:hypothetical protein
MVLEQGRQYIIISAYNIVMCMCDWLEFGCSEHFNTRFVTALNYSAIANLRTLKICRVSTSSLVMASNSGDTSASALTSLPGGSQLH